MRLLTRNEAGKLDLQTFNSDWIPPYAILSHTWYTDSTQEVSFQDLNAGAAETKAGYEKISICDRQAAANGLQHFWIDTCCIDKSSSAELSEAINSMFKWYLDSAICFVYLSDVDVRVLETEQQRAEFAASKWWTRGWTLQELIAPRRVVFYNSEEEPVADKHGIAEYIEQITGIPKEVTFDSKCLYQCSVAQRMSWAAKRITTRKEDVAYALMGLFNVNMPLLYGENEKAFIRLQEEILKDSTDQSLFAWSDGDTALINNSLHQPEHKLQGILAMHPRYFSNSSHIVPVSNNSRDLSRMEIVSTNVGIRMSLALLHQETSLWAVLFATSSKHDIRRPRPRSGMNRGGELHAYIAIAVWPDPRPGGRLMRLALSSPKLIQQKSAVWAKEHSNQIYFSKTNISQQCLYQHHLQIKIRNSSHVQMFVRRCRYAQLNASKPTFFEAERLGETWTFWRPKMGYQIEVLVDLTDGSPDELLDFTISLCPEYLPREGGSYLESKWWLFSPIHAMTHDIREGIFPANQESFPVADLNVSAGFSEMPDRSAGLVRRSRWNDQLESAERPNNRTLLEVDISKSNHWSAGLAA